MIKGLAAGLGVLLALLLAAALCVSSGGMNVEAHETCSVCGAQRVHTSKMGVSVRWSVLEDDCSRWILSQASGAHAHSWVFTHVYRDGSIGCSLMGGFHQEKFLCAARERVGEGPALAALVRDYLTACDAGSVDLEALVLRASQIGAGEQSESAAVPGIHSGARD